MIDAKELRAGNWLLFVGKPVQFQGTACFGSGQFGMQNEHLVPLFKFGDYEYYQSTWEHLHPIPLTEEVLLTLGFKNIDRKVNFGISGFFPDKTWFIPDGETHLRFQSYPNYKHGFCIGSYENKSSFYYSNFRHETIGTELKSLHQLQNLYFALTNSELTYNPVEK